MIFYYYSIHVCCHFSVFFFYFEFWIIFFYAFLQETQDTTGYLPASSANLQLANDALNAAPSPRQRNSNASLLTNLPPQGNQSWIRNYLMLMFRFVSYGIYIFISNVSLLWIFDAFSKNKKKQMCCVKCVANPLLRSKRCCFTRFTDLTYARISETCPSCLANFRTIPDQEMSSSWFLYSLQKLARHLTRSHVWLIFISRRFVTIYAPYIMRIDKYYRGMIACAYLRREDKFPWKNLKDCLYNGKIS